MKIKINLRAKVINEDGKVNLKFLNEAYYRQQLSQFKWDKWVTVTIDNQKSQRSGQQNRYWHGICFPILSDLTGHSQIEVKAIVSQMFIEKKVVSLKGTQYEVRKGTSELSVGEGVDFTQNLKELANELGGEIPSGCSAGYNCWRSDCDICVELMSEIDNNIK